MNINKKLFLIKGIKTTKISAEGLYQVIQPGSSIITTLNPEEAVQKKVCVLEINKKTFKTTGIKLQTIRPYIIDNIKLSNTDLNKNDTESIQGIL
jgi:hypothetical protein